MVLSEQRASEPWGDADRRVRIIEAAERAFVRHGFHAATMHCRCRAGDQPRHSLPPFPLEGGDRPRLCARDQRERARSFAAFAEADRRLPPWPRACATTFSSKPREKMQMVLEIWAEAGRNPAIAALCDSIDAECARRPPSGSSRPRNPRGEAAAELDADFAARAMITVVGRAFQAPRHETDFHGEREPALALGVFAAPFRGDISPLPAGRGGKSGVMRRTHLMDVRRSWLSSAAGLAGVALRQALRDARRFPLSPGRSA